MASELSIHPRNWPSFNGQKKNTAMPHKGGGKLAKKQSALNRRRLEHSATIRSLPLNANPESFRAPGSMNQHK